LTTLEAVDDVVSIVYGSKYKMPEKEHFDELISGTNKAWATINGIRGYKFTNKSDSSKYIFIPAAGYCNGSSLSGKTSECYCWSSSLNINSPYASWYLSITTSGGATTASGRSRCYGCPIRAISTQN